MRRGTYGAAGWIASPTCHVRIVLRPAGLHATAVADLPADLPAEPGPLEPLPPPPAAPAAIAVPAEPSAGQAAVRAALSDVIDPDLGVNIVDLGFVRAVAIEGRTAVITMTLTSAACPLTHVMESQIRTGLAALELRRGLPRRLAVAAGLAAGRHHRQRPRAAQRYRVQLLGCGGTTGPFGKD